MYIFIIISLLAIATFISTWNLIISLSSTLSTFLIPGYYIYIEASTRSAGDTAVLTSPTVDTAGPRCEINFWYHMMGTDIGHLNIYMVQSGAKSLLVKKSFDHGVDIWYESGAYIGAQTNFSIEIEGLISDSRTWNFNYCMLKVVPYY